MMINEDQDVERRLYNEKKKVAGISVTCSMCCCDSMSIYMDDFDIFKSYEESIQIPPTIYRKIFTVESYQEIVAKFPFLSFYINTFLVLIFTIVIELLICSMAAYAFARLNFPGRV